MRANAQIQLAADTGALGGRRRRRLDGIGFDALRQRPFAVDGIAEAVDHPAQPGGAGIDGGRPVLEIGAGAQGDSIQRTQRHDQRPAVAEADHFAGNFLVISDGYASTGHPG